jgi:hypothetical protein
MKFDETVLYFSGKACYDELVIYATERREGHVDAAGAGAEPAV